MPVSTDRGSQRRNTIIFIVVIVVLGGVLYFTGFLVDESMISIKSCQAKYNSIQRLVTSDLCPNSSQPCIAEPYISQHNAFVEAALCACRNIDQEGMADELEAKYGQRFQTDLTAQEICSGSELIKWSYA